MGNLNIDSLSVALPVAEPSYGAATSDRFADEASFGDALERAQQPVAADTALAPPSRAAESTKPSDSPASEVPSDSRQEIESSEPEIASAVEPATAAATPATTEPEPAAIEVVTQELPAEVTADARLPLPAVEVYAGLVDEVFLDIAAGSEVPHDDALAQVTAATDVPIDDEEQPPVEDETAIDPAQAATAQAVQFLAESVSLVVEAESFLDCGIECTTNDLPQSKTVRPAALASSEPTPSIDQPESIAPAPELALQLEPAELGNQGETSHVVEQSPQPGVEQSPQPREIIDRTSSVTTTTVRPEVPVAAQPARQLTNQFVAAPIVTNLAVSSPTAIVEPERDTPATLPISPRSRSVNATEAPANAPLESRPAVTAAATGEHILPPEQFVAAAAVPVPEISVALTTDQVAVVAVESDPRLEKPTGTLEQVRPLESQPAVATPAPSGLETSTPTVVPKAIAEQLGSRVVSRTASQPHLSETDRARFVQRVAGAFQAADEGGGQVRLRLSPPELGAVRLDVTLRAGVLSARLEAETPQARNLLLDHLPALRERLAEQNIKIERFEVDLMDQSPGGQPGFAHRDPPADRDNNLRPRTTVEASESQPAVAPPRRHGGGQLNVVI